MNLKQEKPPTPRDVLIGAMGKQFTDLSRHAAQHLQKQMMEFDLPTKSVSNEEAEKALKTLTQEIKKVFGEDALFSLQIVGGPFFRCAAHKDMGSGESMAIIDYTL